MYQSWSMYLSRVAISNSLSIDSTWNYFWLPPCNGIFTHHNNLNILFLQWRLNRPWQYMYLQYLATCTASFSHVYVIFLLCYMFVHAMLVFNPKLSLVSTPPKKTNVKIWLFLKKIDWSYHLREKKERKKKKKKMIWTWFNVFEISHQSIFIKTIQI